ncbi:MAG: penicillin-binding protein 2, partial [Leucothrix sp.]
MTRRTKQSALISPVYRGRRLALLLLLLAGIVVMLLRAGYLEVFQQSWLQAQADKRQLRTMTIPPYRGMITDRNNEALAISSPVESVWVDPSKYFMKRNEILASVSDTDEKISSNAQNQLDELDVNLIKLRDMLGMKTGALGKLLRDSSAKQFVYLV